MELRPIFPRKENINQTNYYWFEKGFSSDEVDKIINDSLQYDFQKGVIFDESNTDKFRKSNSTTANNSSKHLNSFNQRSCVSRCKQQS